MTQHIIRTLEFKLYPNAEQVISLNRWLGKSCWLFNQALEHRTKAYRRRKESVSFHDQCAWLTDLRDRIESVKLLPITFAKDALRRVDRGMKAFFRRCKAGEKPGFPRFKPVHRYNSLEQLAEGNCIRDGAIFVPKLGEIRARGRFDETCGSQKCLRILRRAHGWYAQVVVKKPVPLPLESTGQECGIDLGLESFATLDSGERIENPRLLRKAEQSLKREQRKLSRCRRGSRRRDNQRKRLARMHEKVSRQRRGHAHRISRNIVNRFDRIAIEKLNVKGLASTKLAKSVHDAGWGQFIAILTVKAESAGRILVAVNPSGTSQTCPRCGAVAKKQLSDREHICGCGMRCGRDHASALVIRQRAFRPACAEGSANTRESEQVGPVMREGSALC